MVNNGSGDLLKDLRLEISKHLPKGAHITDIEFEGSEVALYSKDPSILVDDEAFVRELAKRMKKRIVIRSEPSVRHDKEAVNKIINDIAEKSDSPVEISNIDYDDHLGEVIIEVDKPGVIIGKNAVNLRKIVSETLWRPRVIRTPPIKSRIVRSIRNIIQESSMDRKKMLQRVGKRIHRPTYFNKNLIRVTALGGFREVGRSSDFVQTSESKILIDCGVNVGSTEPSDFFPRLDLPEFDIESLDAIVVSHSHLDHSGYVPYLFKYGYEGPVYCTPPTRDMMTLLQLDYLDVAKKEGKLLPYSQNDVKKCALHTVTLNYGEVTDIAPDLKLTLHNAGHIAGSAIVHLHIGDGQYNIAWARDFKFARSRLLDRAVSKFPRLEALFLESTYGNSNDRLPSRRDCEKELENIINETVTKGGKILIPVLAVGRAQEIMIILEQMIRQKKIPLVPIYIDGLVQEATAVTTAHPEFLSRSLKDRIFNAGANPFLAECFQPVEGSESRSEIVMGDPCIIIATSGMLAGGPSVQYFKDLCGDDKNALIFVSYQGRNTLGSRVQRGLREVIIYESGKNRSYRINFSVHSITGFTGHSDRRELIEYTKQVSPRPKIYLTVHGDERKCLNLASSIHRATGRETLAPHVGQTLVFK